MAKVASLSNHDEARAAKIRAGLEQSIKGISDPVERLKKLYQLSMTLSGDPVDIFRHVAFMIGDMFDVRVVCLSEIRDEELYFISVYVDGEVTTDVGHCALDVTPCATVGSTKDIRTYDEVIEKFPQAGFLKTHNAHSYCGFPALDSNGDVIAVTCLLDDKPHDFTEDDQNILRIFGQRIGFEIERQRELNARERAVQAMQESEKRFRNIVELSNSIPWEFDIKNHRYTYIGPQAKKILGYPAEKWYQEDILSQIVHPDDKDLALEFYQTAVYQGQGGEFEYRLLDKNDKTVWVRDNVTIIPSSNEEYAVQGYMFDITQQKQAEVRVQQLVNYDVLTNLPNRNLLTDRLQQAINLALRQKHFCALLYIDLGRFKNINDSLGYSVGDLLLQEVAAKIQNMMRAADTVARLGGDEFAVLLNDIGGKKEHAASHARMLAAKVLEEIAVPHTIDEQELHISANIGIAVFPEENDTAGDILRHAHTAMNKTKNDGQEDIQFFLPNMQAAALERMELERGLRNALSLGEMSLHYQPIVQVDTNQIIGSEVLLRWKRDDGTMVEPSVFIPIAEETGDIFPIGDWVMRQAARQYVDWQKSGMDISNMFLSVNVCPRQFHQQDFVEKVIQALEETGLSPSTLKLEITEGMILSDIEDTSRKIDRLKSLGISFAIDDFGTGYSSLSYLKELSLDALKIDKSFIRDAENTPDDLVIIETIISMANHLGLDVIAEGVETETSLQFLREKQCHSYQGYHFSRPVPAEIFAELI